MEVVIMGCGSTITAVATGGLSEAGNIIGGLTGADEAAAAAERAAATQAGAAQAGIAEQRRQFDAITAMMSPYLEAGTGALEAQRALAGLGGSEAVYEDIRMSPEEIRAKQMEMAGITPEQLAGIQDSIVGRAMKSSLEQKIASQQVDPITGRRLVTPAVTAEEAQRQAISGIQASPQFEALTQQGEEAMLQRASATGGLRGGDIQGALAQFRPQMLSQLIESQYSKLGGMAGQGQSAAGLQGGYGQQTSSNIANLLQQQGAAQAGGQIAAGQAGQQAFQNILGLGGIAAGFF